MKILLDECLPRKLKFLLTGQECVTVPEAGFAGKRNGALLDLADAHGFDVFLTIDKGLEFEQNMKGRSVAILLLKARSNRLAEIAVLVPSCLMALRTLQPGTVIRIGA